MNARQTKNGIFIKQVCRLTLTACLILLWCSSSIGNPLLSDSILTLEAPSFYDALDSHTRQYHPNRPTVALALSGGGARGLSQIGILRAFEESDIPIVGIAGTSMGAIMGGLLAAGYTPAQLDSLARSISWAELFSDTPPRSYLLLPQKDIRARSFLTLHFRGFRPNLPAAVTAGQRLVRILTELLHAPNYHSRSNFDSLHIPFRCVATDLVSGRTIIQDRGDLVMSLRAASAFPLAQYPVMVDSMILVDGGLTDPLPVDVARIFGADYVIAVNTASELEPHTALDNIYGIANQSTTIMTRPQLYNSVQQADALIQPDLAEFTNLDFEMADSLIARGYRTARHVLDSLMAHGWTGKTNDEDQDELFLDSVVMIDPAGIVSSAAPAAVKNPSSMTMTQLHKRLSEILEEGSIQRVSVLMHRDSSTVFATVTPQAYPRLTAVQFTGNTVFPDSVLRAEFADQIGHRANCQHVAAAAHRCLKLYGNQAYSLAEITEISLDTTNGNLSVTIDEGRLAGLQVTGNKTVKDWVITRHFPLKRGRLFNYRALLEGLENLHASGLYSQVKVKIERARSGPLVTLDVEEKDYDIVRLGLRHDLEYQTDVFVEVVNSNILGLGHEIYFYIGYCPRRERYAAGFRAARVFRTYLTSDFTAYREIHERRLYSDNHRAGFFETARNGLTFSLGQNLKRLGTVSGTFRSEDVKLTRQPPLPTTTARLRSVVVSARYDDLDRLPFTTIGRRLKASVEWADDFAGGNVIYRKIGVSLENWFSPIDQLTLGQRITLGSGDRVLPLYEQYALGGRKSMLGLHDDELLGDKIFSVNFDCRVRFFPRSYLNFRLDLGTVWDHNQEIDLFDDLRIGGGLGPSFDTPLGPLELYWGATEDNYRNFYFNWGYDF